MGCCSILTGRYTRGTATPEIGLLYAFWSLIMRYTRNVEASGGNFSFIQYVIQSHISMVNYCWTFSLIRLNWKTEVSYQLCPRHTHGKIRVKFR